MKTILITGANRGIGLEFCRQYSARGDKVLAACRKSSSELQKLDVTIHSGLDVTDEDSVQELARALGSTRIDVLINNAGVLYSDTLGDLDMDQIREQLEVNTLGPLRVADALRGNLDRGGKLVILTSLMGSCADNGSGGYYGYRLSKAAVNAVGVSLARDLQADGIAVALLHPGMVATEMTGGRGISAQESVAGLLARIDELTLERTGVFWHQDGRELPW